MCLLYHLLFNKKKILYIVGAIIFQKTRSLLYLVHEFTVLMPNQDFILPFRTNKSDTLMKFLTVKSGVLHIGTDD